MANVVGEWLH